MALAKGGDGKQLAKGITGHAQRLLARRRWQIAPPVVKWEAHYLLGSNFIVFAATQPTTYTLWNYHTVLNLRRILFSAHRHRLTPCDAHSNRT
ncbi:hypothetical protein BN874_20044 [Candidatus Contendobacter odensis Run_B_J11]|uniref:Uncharacterized protein n=1 Tax=Candidatus Contendobacter odensis Run_B_J11 TaxID=1400861 RepID=A0A7U7J367_9GAMM|nr:hypothetical protein BN874_20044 [Candidatus Contendobacter odensis Run_B_J11]